MTSLLGSARTRVGAHWESSCKSAKQQQMKSRSCAFSSRKSELCIHRLAKLGAAWTARRGHCFGCETFARWWDFHARRSINGSPRIDFLSPYGSENELYDGLPRRFRRGGRRRPMTAIRQDREADSAEACLVSCSR